MYQPKLMHKAVVIAAILGSASALSAKIITQDLIPGTTDTLTVRTVGPNAYRVTVTPEGATPALDPIYLPTPEYTGETTGQLITKSDALTFVLPNGNFIEQTSYTLTPESQNYWAGSVTFNTPERERQYGTGQFQDGYLDVKGLSRRLTQVNTQISIPMVISDAGYGILWNNCGLTDFNPCLYKTELTATEAQNDAVKVNVTSTTGNRQEERSVNTYSATIDVPATGEYTMLLDCGQSMSRKFHLEVDDSLITKADNVWLPPTTSAKVHLTVGTHKITVKGDKNDRPTLYWSPITGTTTFSSPVTKGIDYTIFIGAPDEIIAQMRALTGEAPMMPKWALGYIHCRERFDTQAELLENAREFRARNIPVDLIVQDWQWWGKNGWNAMVFDADKYPDPKAMTDSLHAMDMRIMLSVWAKVDRNAELGHKMAENGYYIPDTDWIDFFNPEAAEAYWTAYRDNLLPTGIDAWWQDATEPENDDLHGRTVGAGKINGDEVRNVFPLAVNDRVYQGLCESRPDTRPMILTRCGAPGLQRYGAATWSGDVGNDWQTLQRQIKAGLGQSATGLPWWTYDAGGFFRPGDQYNNEDYQKRMIRWIQNAVYLPLMRVHGYMSHTEPWRYSQDTYDKFVRSIRDRYSILPYLYSEAQKVSAEGSTLMRPMIFDFPDDTVVPAETTQYMLGHSLMVSPIVSPDTYVDVYLPYTLGGWWDIYSIQHHEGGKMQKVLTRDDHIPVFAKAGTILPWQEDVDNIKSSTDITNAKSLSLMVFTGADGEFTLYDDDGVSQAYRDGVYTKTRMEWDDTQRTLTIRAPEGKYQSPIEEYFVYLFSDEDNFEVSVPNTNQEIVIKF